MIEKTKIMVFTDLDGTFLDHKTYDYTPALPALKRLHAISSKVIPTTSKTLSELNCLKLPLGETPQIAENGMVVSDGGQHHAIGKNYQEIIAFITNLPIYIREHIKGFHDISIEEVISLTSLTKENAQRAKERLGSEPFLWSGGKEGMNELNHLASAQGLSITQGGRFYHLMGAKSGKADAVKSYLNGTENTISIALGDGPNDAGMLAAVNYGVKIPNGEGNSFDVINPEGDIIEAPLPGPEGWNAAINDLLDRLRF